MADTIHTQPELSDDELLRVYGLAKRDHNYEGPIDDWPKRAERAATVAGLRAAIAADRARRQPETGEVQELVEWLRELGAKRGGVFDVSTFCANLTRAAELLSQRYPQPVPVSERLPDNRDPECVANWPECWSGGYDPRCCRFPKSCSCERGALPLPVEVEG